MSIKYDTDQDNQSAASLVGVGGGGSENKTPSTGGDDNPMLPAQNFSNNHKYEWSDGDAYELGCSELERQGVELAKAWSEALDRAVLDSYLYGVGMVRVSGEDGLDVDVEHIDWVGSDES